MRHENLFKRVLAVALAATITVPLIPCYGEEVIEESYLYEENEVIVEEGVINIGYLAFAGCTALTSVELPESIKGLWDGCFS